MDPAAVPVLTVLTLSAAMFGFFIFAARRQMRRGNDNLARIADSLRLELRRKPPVFGVFEQAAIVDGSHRGRFVRFFTYSTGSGKNRTHWSAVAAGVSGPGGFTLSLSPENLLTRFGEKLGMQDIKTGDEAFDRTFVVKSSDPAYAAAALLPEIRAGLLAQRQAGARGPLRIKDGEVRYAEVGSFSDSRLAERLAAMLDMVCNLAEVADIYRK